MSAVWTIEYDGTEQAAADWGLSAQPVITTRDRMPTVFAFKLPALRITAAPPIPWKGKVIIRQNRTWSGSAWSGTGFKFIGYQSSHRGQVDGRTEGVFLEFSDTIWLLQNTVFQQVWNYNTSDGMGGVTVNEFWNSRCVLFLDRDHPTTAQTINWQIAEALAYAADKCGIEIEAGTIELESWYLPTHQIRAISIWGVILECLEPVPSAKAWVDNSGATPALHVRTRSSLAALTAPTATGPGPITLPYRGTDAAGRLHVSTDLTPRYDLVPASVVCQYQINNTVNGKAAPSFTNDVYPALSTGKEPFAMVVPIDLSGQVTTITTAELDCEAVDVNALNGGSLDAVAHALRRAWWASERGGGQAELADLRVRFQDWSAAAKFIGNATITDDDGNPISLATYPRRLITGTIHDWMRDGGGDPIVAIRAHVKVKVQLTEYDVAGASETATTGNIVAKAAEKELHAQITLTNAPAGSSSYSTAEVEEESEVPVTGLAENCYNARQTLDYDGQHVIVDPGNAGTIPLSVIIGHWNVLNLSGGAAAWETMNATIASTRIDLITNEQSVEFGPAKHLAPQDFSEFLQYFRGRRQFIGSHTRASGYYGANQSVQMPKNTPDGNTAPGLKVRSDLTTIAYDTENDPTSTMKGMVKADAKGVQDILAATTPTPATGETATTIKQVQPKEVAFCDEEGNTLYGVALVGGYYTKA